VVCISRRRTRYLKKYMKKTPGGNERHPPNLDWSAVAHLGGGRAAGDRVVHDGLSHQRRAVSVESAEAEVIVGPQVQASAALRSGHELREEASFALGLANGDVDPILGVGP
jgi:hypothetical protein